MVSRLALPRAARSDVPYIFATVLVHLSGSYISLVVNVLPSYNADVASVMPHIFSMDGVDANCPYGMVIPLNLLDSCWRALDTLATCR